MIEKKYFVIGAVISYIFLTVLFKSVQDSHITKNCLRGRTCVRFCCHDESYCEKSFIRQNFNESYLTKFPDEENIMIVHDKPKCSMVKVGEEDGKRLWSFGFVSMFLKIQAIQLNFIL